MKKKLLEGLATLIFVALAGLAVVGQTLQLPYIKVPERAYLTIAGVTVVRPGEARLENHSMVLDDGLIQTIAPTTADDVSDLEELSGTYALPGLVDMHVHHMPDIGGLTQLWDLLFVAHGITTVRDLGVTMAPDASPMVALSNRIKNGEVIGPRIFYCGPTLDAVPPSIAHFRVVRSEDEARAIVAELAEDGCSCAKTYNRMTPALFRAVHDAAQARGLRHVAHLPNSLDLSEAGEVELQHFAGLGSAETIQQFADYWARWADMTDENMAKIVATSREYDISHTPTISMWANMANMFDPESKNRPEARMLPRFFRDAMWTAEYGEPQLRSLTAEQMNGLAQAIPKMQRLTRMLHDAGMPVFIGTDPVMPHGIPGYALHQEMRLFVDAGFTPEQVWEIATKDAGDWLGDTKIGRIERGAYADILFFENDPTLDLAHLDTLVGVVADGRYYSKQALDDAMAEQQAQFEGALFDTLSMAIVKMFF